MARALWTGFVSFGLVSVPVGMFRATEDQTFHFNQIHKGTSHRIRYKKVDEVTGEEVPAEEIVNGYDPGDGQYVIVTKEELKAAAPGRSELIEISDFVDLSSIDPIYFRSSYYLAPRGKGADRAYSLLRQAMQETNKIAIATLVLRDKEHLVAIRPGEQALVLETMFFPAEIRSAAEELDSLPQEVTFEGRELDVAKTLVNSLSVDWEPDRYENTYRARVEDLIETKRKGNAVVAKAESRPKTNVVDLMSALEASVARAKDGGSKTAAQGDEPDLAELTKPELLALAADYDISGRSGMSKADLVAALAAAGATTKRNRRKASATA
ncbi:MAG TPA: Ku protein [Mycobacteriales bacterium]|nr:Ku protein [Mycobacteriales bacterium]